MKILHVITSLGAGGAERSLAETLPLLRTYSVSSMVACLHRRQEGVEDEVRRSGIEVHVPRGRNAATRLTALRRMIARNRPDLIHTSIFEADIVGRITAVRTRIPVISSLVNTTYDAVRLEDPNVSRLGFRIARTMDGWTARHLTDHFLAVSHSVEASAVAHLGIPPERVTVVYRGRDAARLGESDPGRRDRVRAKLGLAFDAEVLITVGRLEFQKGHRDLVEAARLLAPMRPRLRLLIVGRDGNLSGEVRRMVERYALGSVVMLLGHRYDVPDLLAASDLFVLPSLYEGLPGAVIEAMGLSLPVVASDIPAVREVVEEGHSGALIPSGSPTALAKEIGALLDHPSRLAEFGRHGRRIFEDRFTLDESARRTAALYESVLRRAASR